ncbi:hypothetical protein GCM10018787_40760 [Streptomyces thermodiastaticus]|nr:hypothetical protein GCM10018787_40760 [Streptomyces thermodiastaticus]
MSVWASLASATARKETRIAQNTATRIPATSPPDTVRTRSLIRAWTDVRRAPQGAPRDTGTIEKVVLRAYRAADRAPYRNTGRQGRRVFVRTAHGPTRHPCPSPGTGRGARGRMRASPPPRPPTRGGGTTGRGGRCLPTRGQRA